MLVFLVVSIAPILAISFFLLNQAKNNFQNQTTKLLTLAADNAEGHVLTFFERQKIRLSDWSSDGHIRAETEAITRTGDMERAKSLSAYFRDKKLPLDTTVVITDIFDLSGRVIASSEEKRIGHTEPNTAELERKYGYITAKNKIFGQSVIGSVIIIKEEEGHPALPMIHLSIPIVSPFSDEIVGVMINHISGDELNSVISGKQQLELGALTGGGPIFETLETYLVNKDGLMITPSRLIADAVLKQKVFTDATRACLEDGREISGRYKDYRGVWVYGASMCPRNQPWMLLLEIDEKEILAVLNHAIRITCGGTFALVILVSLFAFFWGRRLTEQIMNLVVVTNKIGRGNFKEQILSSGNDEIAQLGGSINKMTADLKKYVEQLKSLDSLKHKFIQIVSHQLRTPLNSIRWNLEMLLEDDIGKLTKTQKEFVRLTYTANTIVIKRISDLLTAMDIEEGRIAILKDNASLESLLTSVISEYKKNYEMREITCEYTPPVTPLPTISVDSEKIRQVFARLVENALIYTPEKGKITAKLFQKDNQLWFEITDTGIGIPAAEQNKIFTKFYRASNASVMMPDASGLGLAIAKYYVEQHGGKIGFASEEVRGSTFWFELPIK